MEADFSASPLQGSAPLTVTFTNQSTPADSLTAYRWQFGDGFTSTMTNPVHSYVTAGHYTVTLTAWAGAEAETVTRTNLITVTAGVTSTPTLVTTTIRYTHDPLQRLTGAVYSGAYTYTFAYAYDKSAIALSRPKPSLARSSRRTRMTPVGHYQVLRGFASRPDSDTIFGNYPRRRQP